MGWVFCFAAMSLADEPPLLRMHFVKGALFRYEMATTTKTTVHVTTQSEEPQTATQTTQYRLSQRVVDVDEKGNGVVEARIESLRVVGEMGDLGSVFYDSTLPSDGSNPAADVYAGLVDKPFRMTTTPRGQVIKVEGFAKLFEDVAKEGEPGVDISTMLTGLLGDESWNALLQMAQPLLPENPMSSWETKTEIPLPLFGKVEIASKYALLGRTLVDNVSAVQLGFEMASDSTPEPSSQTLGIVRMTSHLKDFHAKGTYEIGVDDGWVVSGKTVQTMRITMTIDAPSLGSGRASLDFTTETTTTTTRLPNEMKEVSQP